MAQGDSSREGVGTGRRITVTDPFSVARAAIDQATAMHQTDQQTIATYQQAVATRDRQLTADQQTIAAQATRIAELEAQLDPTPSPPIIQWGMDAITKAQHDDALAIFGPGPLAWRYYLQPGEALHYPTEYALRPGEVFVESGKVLPQDLTVAQMVSFFRNVPTDRDFIYSPWHEGEDDVEKGHFTSAQLKAAYHVCRQAAAQVGPHIKIVCILMGYTWQTGSKRNPEDFIPADEDFDYLTTDTYFAGSIGQSVDKIPTAFDAQIATAKAHGKPWGITETGIGQKVTGQARLDAIKLLAQTIKDKGAFVGCWFQNNSTRAEWRLRLDDGTAAAWKAGQAG
jgi:hypothetical protein